MDFWCLMNTIKSAYCHDDFSWVVRAPKKSADVTIFSCEIQLALQAEYRNKKSVTNIYATLISDIPPVIKEHTTTTPM